VGGGWGIAALHDVIGCDAGMRHTQELFCCFTSFCDNVFESCCLAGFYRIDVVI
jgi:hypothetical protein